MSSASPATPLFERPSALHGEVIEQIPSDLYIPPDALRVVLQAFEGPLDLLLYLIRRQNVDILDIKVAEITKQYMEYIQMMSMLRLQLAGDYLVMAATLAEIKSSMLLPSSNTDLEDEDDPRADLVRRLAAYQEIKNAAVQLDQLPRVDRELHLTSVSVAPAARQVVPPDVAMGDLIMAFAEVLARAKLHRRHEIERSVLSVRQRMTEILAHLDTTDQFVRFVSLFLVSEGRQGVVCSFVAILELVRDNTIRLVQSAPFEPIFVSRSTSKAA